MKRKQATSKTDLPELCRAVQKIRATAGWSQEAMGRHVGLALQTIYRFEKGLQIPKDYGVLCRLRDVAMTLGLTEEATAFDYAAQGWHMIPANAPRIPSLVVSHGQTPQQRRLAAAARLAVIFNPAEAAAGEVAFASTLAFLDAALKDSVHWNTVWDEEFYSALEAKAAELMKQKVFHTRKKRKANREEN
jgi:DNA-binding XRE family transcriptional regulator